MVWDGDGYLGKMRRMVMREEREGGEGLRACGGGIRSGINSIWNHNLVDLFAHLPMLPATGPPFIFHLPILK